MYSSSEFELLKVIKGIKQINGKWYEFRTDLNSGSFRVQKQEGGYEDDWGRWHISETDKGLEFITRPDIFEGKKMYIALGLVSEEIIDQVIPLAQE